MPKDRQVPVVPVHRKVQDWILHKDQQETEAQYTVQAAGIEAGHTAGTAAAPDIAAGTAKAADIAAAGYTAVQAVVQAADTAADTEAVLAAGTAAGTETVQAAGTAAEQVPEVQELNTVLQEHTALQLH